MRRRLFISPTFPFNPAKWPFFYGWFIIFLGTLGMLASIPGQTIGVSAFTEHLLDALDISRNKISSAYMIGTAASAFILTYAGKFFDRFGARITGVLAAVLLMAILFYLSIVDKIAAMISSPGSSSYGWVALTVMTLGFFLLRFFGQGVTAMTNRNMMMKWFDKRRGLANSFSSIVVSLGFSASPVIFTNLIEISDWRWAWRILGLSIGIGFSVIIFIFYRDNPEEVDLVPDGKQINYKKERKSAFSPVKDFVLKEARSDYAFWIFTLIMAMQGLYITGFSFHVESIFDIAGFTRDQAFKIFLPSAVIALGITIPIGYLSDLIRLKYLLLSMGVGAMLACSGLLVLDNGQIGYYMIIAGNGLVIGFFNVLMAVTYPRFYGKKNLGTITGFAMSVLVLFSSVGPYIFSQSLDLFGTYKIAGIVCLFFFMLITVGGFWAENPQEKIKKQMESGN